MIHNDVPAFYKTLSLKLHAALGALGGSTEISRLTKERGIVNEVLSFFVSPA